jgi:hypothetical protein
MPALERRHLVGQVQSGESGIDSLDQRPAPAAFGSPRPKQPVRSRSQLSAIERADYLHCSVLQLESHE